MEGRPATCITHGSPDAARCEDAPESMATGVSTVTSGAPPKRESLREVKVPLETGYTQQKL